MMILPNHKNNRDKAFDLAVADRLHFIGESNINTLPDFADPKIFDILDASFDIDTKWLNNEEM